MSRVRLQRVWMTTQYARLDTDINCALRRGAWYRVLRLAPLEAVLDVARRELRFIELAGAVLGGLVGVIQMLMLR